MSLLLLAFTITLICLGCCTLLCNCRHEGEAELRTQLARIKERTREKRLARRMNLRFRRD